MPAALRDDIIAAFSDDGVIAVTTAAAAAPGDSLAYALGGTVRRDGDKLRVIARLSNERSGTTLWSHSFSYDAKDAARVPRWVAIDAGGLVRCGLFGISTSECTIGPGRRQLSPVRATKTRPDFCSASRAPPVCRAI